MLSYVGVKYVVKEFVFLNMFWNNKRAAYSGDEHKSEAVAFISVLF